MLRAAYDCFCDRGYAKTTMQAIADRADVAVQTLYFTFNTKSALLSESFEAAILGFELWEGPITAPIVDGDLLLNMHPWFAAVRDEPDPRRALAAFVDGAMAPMLRAGPLIAVMHAAGDPVVQDTLHLGEARREDSWRGVIRLLADKGGHRAKSEAEALDVMMVLLSAEVVHASMQRGWSEARITAWLTELLADQLLGE